MVLVAKNEWRVTKKRGVGERSVRTFLFPSPSTGEGAR
jgi:hypothetical protein